MCRAFAGTRQRNAAIALELPALVGLADDAEDDVGEFGRWSEQKPFLEGACRDFDEGMVWNEAYASVSVKTRLRLLVATKENSGTSHEHLPRAPPTEPILKKYALP
jgi:hypothetical protein